MDRWTAGTWWTGPTKGPSGTTSRGTARRMLLSVVESAAQPLLAVQCVGLVDYDEAVGRGPSSWAAAGLDPWALPPVWRATLLPALEARALGGRRRWLLRRGATRLRGGFRGARGGLRAARRCTCSCARATCSCARAHVRAARPARGPRHARACALLVGDDRLGCAPDANLSHHGIHNGDQTQPRSC